jgi:hypothetical protein
MPSRQDLPRPIGLAVAIATGAGALLAIVLAAALADTAVAMVAVPMIGQIGTKIIDTALRGT